MNYDFWADWDNIKEGTAFVLKTSDSPVYLKLSYDPFGSRVGSSAVLCLRPYSETYIQVLININKPLLKQIEIVDLMPITV